MLPAEIYAPDFELYGTPTQKVKLADLGNRKVILAFYLADWNPVCSEQLALYNRMENYFHRHNAQLIGISVDSQWSHKAFSEQHHFHFPLLADFEPKGEIARLYEVYNEKTEQCHRGLYVIDEVGVIRWSYRSLAEIYPGPEILLNALELLNKSRAVRS